MRLLLMIYLPQNGAYDLNPLYVYELICLSSDVYYKDVGLFKHQRTVDTVCGVFVICFQPFDTYNTAGR
jgi:hypothetical protein